MSVGDVTLRRGDGGCGGAAAATDITYGLRQPLTASDKATELSNLHDRIAHRDAQPDVHLCVHDDLDEICAEWRSFEQHADHTVFQSIDWLANWQRHIGALQELVPAIVIGREADGEILFILPFAVEALGPIRRLSWLGSRLCDYNAPLLAERFSAHVSVERFMLAWRDIIRLLRADPRFRFDLIDLKKMPECVGAQRNPFLDLQVRAHPSGAYAAVLGADWGAFYAAKRSSSTRKRERRQLRQLADHGTVCFAEIEDCEERARTLSTLFEQKSRVLASMGIDNPFFSVARTRSW
jgi:CelD/BcsL family acetyltransferase involved in cellulose biosynthesis